MTISTINRSAEGPVSTSRYLPEFLTRIGVVVGNYIARSRAERQLEALDDRVLLDIGVSRSEIHRMVWGEPPRNGR